jgi:hypothetical protein
MLEKNGKVNGKIFAIDGSPQYINRIAHKYSIEGNRDKFKNGVALLTFDTLKHNFDDSIVKEAFESQGNWIEKLKRLIQNINGKFSFDIEYVTKTTEAVENRLKICQNTKDDSFSQLNSTKIFLTRASKPAITGIHKDYGLAKLCNIPIKIIMLEGDHVTILNNLELRKFINENL